MNDKDKRIIWGKFDGIHKYCDPYFIDNLLSKLWSRDDFELKNIHECDDYI